MGEHEINGAPPTRIGTPYVATDPAPKDPPMATKYTSRRHRPRRDRWLDDLIGADQVTSCVVCSP